MSGTGFTVFCAYSVRMDTPAAPAPAPSSPAQERLKRDARIFQALLEDASQYCLEFPRGEVPNPCLLVNDKNDRTLLSLDSHWEMKRDRARGLEVPHLFMEHVRTAFADVDRIAKALHKKTPLRLYCLHLPRQSRAAFAARALPGGGPLQLHVLFATEDLTWEAAPAPAATAAVEWEEWEDEAYRAMLSDMRLRAAHRLSIPIYQALHEKNNFATVIQLVSRDYYHHSKDIWGWLRRGPGHNRLVPLPALDVAATEPDAWAHLHNQLATLASQADVIVFDTLPGAEFGAYWEAYLTSEWAKARARNEYRRPALPQFLTLPLVPHPTPTPVPARGHYVFVGLNAWTQFRAQYPDVSVVPREYLEVRTPDLMRAIDHGIPMDATVLLRAHVVDPTEAHVLHGGYLMERCLLYNSASERAAFIKNGLLQGGTDPAPV